MIHIDDLVRQRLDGAEEPDRAGSWLRMKELLDKEMPVQTGTGSGRKRIIGYFAGLLLLTAASVGGYQYYSDNQSGIYVSGGSDELYSESNTTPEVLSVTMPARNARSSEPGQHSSSSSSTGSSKQDAAGSISGANQSAANASIQRHNTGSTHQGGNNQQFASNVPARSATNFAEGHNDKSTDPLQKSSNTPLNSGGSNQKSVPGLGTEMNNASANNNRNTVPVEREAISFSTLPLQAANGRTLNMLPTASSTRVNPPTTRPVHFRFETIETIEIVHHRVYDANTQKIVYRIDTVPKGKQVVARAVPEPATASAKENSSIAGNQPKPKTTKETSAKQSAPVAKSAGAAGPLVAKNDKPAPAENVVPQSSVPGLAGRTDESQNAAAATEQKSAGKHFKLWDAEKFEEAVEKFKYKMAKIQVFPGVMGGINASLFTPNALGGFQIGLTSLIAMNDWWSLMVELKYIHRFNTGSTVRDDYMSVVPGTSSVNFVTGPNGQSMKEYVWKDQSVAHYFNFDAVQTLEMPVALRYNWGRVYAQGGANLTYSMPIKASEVTYYRNDTTPHRVLYPATHDDVAFIEDDKPLVKLEDFGPRFGVGYVLGGGFMFSPAVYMDLRVAQTFWDNSKTEGAKQISNDLLRTPSLQFSVGYRFGQNK